MGVEERGSSDPPEPPLDPPLNIYVQQSFYIISRYNKRLDITQSCGSQFWSLHKKGVNVIELPHEISNNVAF